MSIEERTESQQRHYQKYDELARRVGINFLAQYMPVTREKMRDALSEDRNLNNIPLQRWDTKANLLRLPVASSLSDRVCLLKHVAIYYYARKGD